MRKKDMKQKLLNNLVCITYQIEKRNSGLLDTFEVYVDPKNFPRENQVYEVSSLEPNFDFSLVGSYGEEGHFERFRRRFSGEEEETLRYILSLHDKKRVLLRPIFQHPDREILYLLEQIAIMDKAHDILCKKGYNKIPKDQNIFNFRWLFGDKLLNQRFDRKESLRYYLAHPDMLNPNDYKI